MWKDMIVAETSIIVAVLFAVSVATGVCGIFDKELRAAKDTATRVTFFLICCAGLFLCVGMMWWGKNTTTYQYNVPMNWSGNYCSATLQDGNNIRTNDLVMNTEGKNGIQIKTYNMWFGLLKYNTYKAIVAAPQIK